MVDKHGNSYACSQWCDLLTPAGAEPIAWYDDDFFAGQPAVTVRKLGKGRIVYIGTIAEERYYIELFRALADEIGLTRLDGLPEGVQISVRSKGQKRYLFVLNLSRQRQEVALGGTFESLLNESRVGPALTLEPYGVEIVAWT